MLRAELCRLEEQPLHHGVMLPVPVNAGLRHQHGDIPLQLVVIQLKTSLFTTVHNSKLTILVHKKVIHAGLSIKSSSTTTQTLTHLNLLIVPRQPCVLDLFREFSELVNVFCWKLIELSVGLFNWRRDHDACILWWGKWKGNKLCECRRESSESSHHIGCAIKLSRDNWYYCSAK